MLIKFLSFLLLPVAALFGILCLLSLITALGNPTLLISVFLNACLVIYIIASFMFFTKGIDNNQPCKPVLRDWIRINGIISLVFYLLVTFMFVAIKMQPSLLNDAMNQMEAQGGTPPGVSMEELKSATINAVTYFLILSIAIVVHAIITFHLLRVYKSLFEPEQMDLEK